MWCLSFDVIVWLLNRSWKIYVSKGLFGLPLLSAVKSFKSWHLTGRSLKIYLEGICDLDLSSFPHVPSSPRPVLVNHMLQPWSSSMGLKQWEPVHYRLYISFFLLHFSNKIPNRNSLEKKDWFGTRWQKFQYIIVWLQVLGYGARSVKEIEKMLLKLVGMRQGRKRYTQESGWDIIFNDASHDLPLTWRSCPQPNSISQ